MQTHIQKLSGKNSPNTAHCSQRALLLYIIKKYKIPYNKYQHFCLFNVLISTNILNQEMLGKGKSLNMFKAIA